MRWLPKQYDTFSEQRSTPIDELLADIPQQNFQLIYDIGCGTGAAIPGLRKNWPDAKIIALDSDADMLAAAKDKYPDVSFIHTDIETWLENTQPTDQTTLVFSNAALHWLDNHETLFPRLMALLGGNGCLAVQMPNNWRAPSHLEMIALAKQPPWGQQLKPLIIEKPVLDQQNYQDILRSISSELRLWTTTYEHKLKGSDPVINWLMGSSLKYYLDGMANEYHENYLKILAEKLNAAYPEGEGGYTTFPFTRLFLVAQA